MAGITVPNPKENLGDTVHIFVAADVPLDGVVDVASQGLWVVNSDGVGQQTPAETFAAEPAWIIFLEAVVGVLGEIKRSLETVVGDDGERCPVAGEVHIVDVDVGATVFDMLEIPKWEGVVVAHGEKDGAVVAALQMVEADVVNGVAVVSVVVAPVADSHESRCKENDYSREVNG